VIHRVSRINSRNSGERSENGADNEPSHGMRLISFSLFFLRELPGSQRPDFGKPGNPRWSTKAESHPKRGVCAHVPANRRRRASVCYAALYCGVSILALDTNRYVASNRRFSIARFKIADSARVSAFSASDSQILWADKRLDVTEREREKKKRERSLHQFRRVPQDESLSMETQRDRQARNRVQD